MSPVLQYGVNESPPNTPKVCLQHENVVSQSEDKRLAGRDCRKNDNSTYHRRHHY